MTKTYGFGYQTAPCGLCGKPTPMLGTKRCDTCHELEGRIQMSPDLARRILAGLNPKPLDMILHCPACGMQHIDKDNSQDLRIEAAERGIDREGDRECDRWIEEREWTNPPHRSHLCAGCGHIWRPADVPTNGVASIQTRGKEDSPAAGATMRRIDAAAEAMSKVMACTKLGDLEQQFERALGGLRAIQATAEANPAAGAEPGANALIDEFQRAAVAWNASKMENDVRERYRNAYAALFAALAPPATSERDAEDARQVLMEHSGCGNNTQVDQLTVRLNPGDKVVLFKGPITAALDAQREQSEKRSKEGGNA